MDFYSAYRHGFVRVAACTHHTTIADPAANAESVLRLARACHDDAVALAVFPELTLSGYSIEDILLQDALLDAVEEALVEVVAASAVLLPVLVVGAPLRHGHRIYNTAVVIHRGSIRSSPRLRYHCNTSAGMGAAPPAARRHWSSPRPLRIFLRTRPPSSGMRSSFCNLAAGIFLRLCTPC